MNTIYPKSLTIAIAMPSSSECTRVPSLWFDDGTIVIQAGSHLYKIYSGVLSSKSSVFKDMFSIPQPPHQELVDGCPLVQLPDSPSDVTPFFLALFDSECHFFREPPHKVAYEFVAGVLRQSTKYDVPYLRRRAIVHLRTVFPVPYPTHIGKNIETVIMSRSAYLSSINLARQCDTLWMLPFAFYHSALEYAFAIWKGEHTVEAFLSVEDERLTAMSCIKLCRAKSQLVFEFMKRRCDSAACNEARITSAQKCLDSSLPDPHLLDLDIDWAHFESLACPKCFRDERNRKENELLEHFDKLPEYLNLPGWDKLDEAEQTDLS